MKLFLIFLITICFSGLFCQSQYEMNRAAGNQQSRTEKKLQSITSKIFSLYKDDTLFIEKFKKSQK